jgi:hypothetical protein
MKNTQEQVKKLMTRPQRKKPLKPPRKTHMTGEAFQRELEEAYNIKHEKEARKKERETAKLKKQYEQGYQKWLKEAHRAGGKNIKMTPRRTTRSPMPTKRAATSTTTAKPKKAHIIKIKQEKASDDERDEASSDSDYVPLSKPAPAQKDGVRCIQ